MQEYDGSHNTPFPYEYGYSQGYEVNIQLRRGERLTRNWFNKGLHINGMLARRGRAGLPAREDRLGAMAYLTGYGDLASGPDRQRHPGVRRAAGRRRLPRRGLEGRESRLPRPRRPARRCT